MCMCILSCLSLSSLIVYIAAAFIEEICRKRKNIIICILLLEHRNRKEPHFNLSQVLFISILFFSGGLCSTFGMEVVCVVDCVCVHIGGWGVCGWIFLSIFILFFFFFLTSSACARVSFVILLSATTHLTGGPYFLRVSFSLFTPIELLVSLHHIHSFYTLHARRRRRPNKHTQHNRGPRPIVIFETKKKRNKEKKDCCCSPPPWVNSNQSSAHTQHSF